MNDIQRFLEPGDPDTGYLSNFFRAPFELDGHTWPTVEHYYQAQKLEDEGCRTRIREAASPREAKTLGQARDLPLREDWATQRIKIMIAALSAKFAQNRKLLNRLLNTGEDILVEASPTDAFWGDGPDGQGENRLGYLLMSLRDTYRALLRQGMALVDGAGAAEQLAQQFADRMSKTHVAWLLPGTLRQEAQIGVIGDHLNPYARDLKLKPPCLERYQPGVIFREPTLCDASEHVRGFAAQHRFLLLSANAKHLDALFGGVSGSPGTGLCVFQPDSLWKVLAVHRNEDHAQITLLEIPPVGIHAFNCQAFTEFEQELANRVGSMFESMLKLEPVAACSAPEWLDRVQLPLGLKDDGEFLECWFNGIHRGGDASEPLPPVKIETPEPVAAPLFPPLTPRARLFIRLVGIAVLLIGLIMIVMGGLVAWKPDTLH